MVGTILTRREMFAAMMLQGLLGHYPDENAPKYAVELADALIAELGRNSPAAAVTMMKMSEKKKRNSDVKERSSD